MSRRPNSDQGQVTLLILGFTVVAMLMVTVVVAASQAFLARRSLTSWADGAAVVAAQRLDPRGLYGDGAEGSTMPVSQAEARASVLTYVQDNDLPARFPGLAVTQVRVDRDGSVTVGLAATVQLPLVNRVTASYADGLRIATTATARGRLG